MLFNGLRLLVTNWRLMLVQAFVSASALGRMARATAAADGDKSLWP